LNFLDLILNTNIFISLAAVFLAVETQVQLGLKPQLQPYLFLIFFATLFEYNLHRLVTVVKYPEVFNNDKHKWVKQHLSIFYIILTLSMIGFIYTLFQAKKQILITLAPIALITFLYSLPVLRNKRKVYSLREIPFIKIFLIALVWSVITIILPILYMEDTNINLNAVMMFAERFLFISAMAIPFDIRDMTADLNAGIKTIPLVFGEKTANRMSNVLMILFILLTFSHYLTMSMKFLLPAYLVSALSTIILINHKKLKEFKYYYIGFLDGTMLFQGFLVCVFYYLNFF
jgi:4-hydroxybenzoate polyprenyltransferase